MLCKKCRKEISEGSLYCNFCGKKQETTKRKVRRRPRGAGCIRHRTDCRDNPYIAYTPATIGGAGERYLGAFATYTQAQAALDKYFNSIHIPYGSLTVAQVYENGVQSILKASQAAVSRVIRRLGDTLTALQADE